MLKFFIICILLCVCVAFQTEDQHDVKRLKRNFDQFIKKYNKQYKDESEKNYRFSIFIDNVRKAEEQNQLKGPERAEFGITKFSDWTKEEFKRLLGHRPHRIDNIDYSKGQLVTLQKYNEEPAPDAYDWRTDYDYNVVTRVKDQGDCGSCWAFGATGNIESQYALKHGKLVELSEQQLMDCNKDNGGCDGGGRADEAFKDLIDSGELLATEEKYPYEDIEKNFTCEYRRQKGLVNVTGYAYINATDEDELKQSLYEYGPLTFGMNAKRLHFLKGIFSGCGNNTKTTHELLLVGYGTTDSGEDYWTVKNSWGKNWHGDGYFKMKRGINICDILTIEENIYTSQVA